MHPIREYMFRISFLSTLNIYKEYFKGFQMLRKCEAKFCSCKLWPETEFALGFCNQGALWSSSCDELKNFAANIFLKLVIKSRTRIRASIG